MTSSTSHLAAEERADARFAEQIGAHARQYLAYLDARLTLLEIEAARASVAFERTDVRDDEERAAQATIAGLPPASRALFAAVVEQERLEVPSDKAGRGVDPDEATVLALKRLRDEAGGIGTEGGKGLIPRGTPEAIKWYAVDIAALRAAPSAAAYAAGSIDTHTRQRAIWQAGGALTVLLLALLWLFVPHGAHSVTNAPQTATANGTELAAWPVRELVVTATHGDIFTVPVSPTASLTWPAASSGVRAYWHPASVWPLRLCLPPALLADATEVRMAGDGASPDRIYTLISAPRSPADLILAPCGSGDNVPATRSATLSATAPQPIHAMGETVRLALGAITPTGVTLIGPGQDPTLPPEQARVAVRVRAPRAIDWPMLAPTLVLPSGAAVLPSSTATISQGTELRYLIPLPAETLPVVWQLNSSPAGVVSRWRATLDPPPSRTEVLRAALAVEPPKVTPGEARGTIAIAVAVVNRGTAPLQLTNNDITLAMANQPPSTPDLSMLRQPLAPGERRTITLAAPLEERSTLTLTIGVTRFAIARDTAP
jgi:hypothetical protein